MIPYLAELLTGFAEGEAATGWLLLLAFLAAASLFLFILVMVRPAVESRRRIRQQLFESGVSSRQSLLARQEAERLEAEMPVEQFYRRMEGEDADSLEQRLLRAGYYSRSAKAIFYAIRFGVCTVAFVSVFFPVVHFFPWIPVPVVFFFSFLYALMFLVIPNIVLDRQATKAEEACRRGFPDFMDMMIVCADAGMSLEAAAQRVSDEIAATHKGLGLHLKVMVLEMRAGRPLRDALHNLGERLAFEEAKTLAVLFKQSEELGTSLTHTLRVYSDEMREKRVVRAEEKANALPVKMMVPLGLCVFPFILVMILLPVLLRMHGVFF